MTCLHLCRKLSHQRKTPQRGRRERENHFPEVKGGFDEVDANSAYKEGEDQNKLGFS